MTNYVIARAMQAEKEEEPLLHKNRSKSIEVFDEIKEALRYQESQKNPIKVGKEAASRYSSPRVQNPKLKALPNPPIFEDTEILKQLENENRQISEQ
jgi:hypothetical protein